MESYLHHVHLFASDIKATVGFYRRWFGAEVFYDAPFAGARNVFLKLGHGRIHLYDQAPRDGVGAVHHLGLCVEDLEEQVARMEAGGVPIQNDIKHLAEASYIMVEGPDGVLLELFEVNRDKLTPSLQNFFPE